MPGPYAMGGYASTPAIWLPLIGAAFAVGMALYCWRRRDVPAVWPLFFVFAISVVCFLASALSAAATIPEAKIAWFKVGQASLMPALTAGTCFVLEYTYPGRWLTRRNLALLAIPPLLVALFIFTGQGQLVWDVYTVSPVGTVMRETTIAGDIFALYALGLTLLNAAALLWLFVRSPLHRWPVAMMLAGQLAGRMLAFVDFLRQPWMPPFDLLVAGILIWSAFYAVAAFGFRMFDPLPVARREVFRQLPAGGVVFDARGRVLSLNPAAETILGATANGARGKTCGELFPTDELLAARLGEGQSLRQKPALAGQSANLPEITLGTGPQARHYAPVLSPLSDFRGLLLGYLLVLPDMTEMRRAQTQVLEHERMQAIQSERERMARELHDSLGQVLSYTSMQVETAAQLALDGQGEAAAARLSRLGTVVRDAHADLRESILNLQSAARFEDPFCSVAQHYLDGFTRNYDIRAQLHVEGNFGEEALRPETKLHLLRILQEALSNARKHGQAHQVQVTLARANGCLRMTVEDDGIGFDPQQVARDGEAHFGLQFMADRAEELGGSLQVTSAPGGGTRVVLEIPADGPRLTGDGGRL